jgi:hypothetical protein
LCRDTAAGQALFKAYGGHQQAKVKGQQYSQRNQEIFQRMLALGVLPRPPKGEDCSAHMQAAAHTRAPNWSKPMDPCGVTTMMQQRTCMDEQHYFLVAHRVTAGPASQLPHSTGKGSRQLLQITQHDGIDCLLTCPCWFCLLHGWPAEARKTSGRPQPKVSTNTAYPSAVHVTVHMHSPEHTDCSCA